MSAGKSPPHEGLPTEEEVMTATGRMGSPYLIGALTKCLPFIDNIFKFIFLNRNCVWIKIS